MGWDGTLWGIDAQGAPHVCETVNAAWAQHGDGIDAAASSFSNDMFVFRGSEVVAVNPCTLQASTSKPIAAQWPNLPDSFTLGVVGAAHDQDSGDAVYIFKPNGEPGAELNIWAARLRVGRSACPPHGG